MPDPIASKAARQALVLALILVGVGIVMVYSSSSVVARNRFDDSSFFLQRQILRAMIGVAVMFAAAQCPLSLWRRLSRPLLIAGLFSLVLVLLVGHGRGAQRWLPFPVPAATWSLSFQPSEFVKLVLVLYLADVLARKEDVMQQWKDGLLPRLIVVGAILGLILVQPDLGTSIAIGVTAVSMLWLGGAGSLHLAVVVLASVPVAAISLLQSPYQMARLVSFVRGADPLGAGFQVAQSLLALGSGGFFGVGLGNSMQKYYLPAPHTDFVFAFVGEEFGLAGTVSVLALFAVLAIHGLRIARDAATQHGFLLASGITVMISAYAAINVGVTMGVLPTTGLPLPFVSYGGSSLVWNLAAVGILAAVARESAVTSTASTRDRLGGGRARNLGSAQIPRRVPVSRPASGSQARPQLLRRAGLQ